MKTNDNKQNPEMKGIGELTPEELEDVTGGGLKEIVAATTLAAMAMTGNTVSAFGLANALAEDSAAHSEEAPAQDSLADAYAGDMAEAIEVETDYDVAAADVEEAVPEVDEADAVLADTDENIALSALEAGDGEVQEFAEVEFDLGDPDGEATIIDEGAEDPEQTMKDLIDMTVNETRDQGLYVTLNSVFATLADNADAISDPETGLVVMDGNQIVNNLYDKLAENFDNTPEELMGAIGTAADRANDQGYINALGGDVALVSLAASASSTPTGYDYLKSSYDFTIDQLGQFFPVLKPYVASFKGLFGLLFSKGSAADNGLKQQLEDIKKKIDSAEESIKKNTYNVVQMDSIMKNYTQVMDLISSVRKDIANINRSDESDAQKLQEIADIAKTQHFQDLEVAMEGATRCFYSKDNSIYANQNIFEAAYARACEYVMFSGEAIDISVPFLMEQITLYTSTYVTMGVVYDAYTTVYGADKYRETREDMGRHLAGVDFNGNKVTDSVFDLLLNYMQRDRFIFVNKGHSNIKLKPTIVVKMFNEGENVSTNPEINTIMQKMPLDKSQVQSLVTFACDRRRTLFDYLFNDLGFYPVKNVNDDPFALIEKLKQIENNKMLDINPLYPIVYGDIMKLSPAYQAQLDSMTAFAGNYGKGFSDGGAEIYLPAGKQSLNLVSHGYWASKTHYYVQFDGFWCCDSNHRTPSTEKLFSCAGRSKKFDHYHTYMSCTILSFMGR